MKEAYALEKVRHSMGKQMEKQHPSGLKVLTWITAYAAWIFIFLIPVIGIILIIIYLLKNRQPASSE